MSEQTTQRIEVYYPPLTFSLEMVNKDTTASTIGMRASCQLTDMFCYEKDVLWFATADYDKFVTDLSSVISGAAENASLEDTNRWFKLTISKYPKAALFEVAANYHHPTYGSDAHLSYSCPMHYDLIGVIRDRFRDFPKWWQVASGG